MEMVVWLPQSALYLLTKCDDRINLPFPRNGCNNNTRQKTLEAFTKELICRYQFFFYIASSSSLITAFLAVQEDGFFLIIRMKIAIVFVERVKSLPRQKSRYHHIDSFHISKKRCESTNSHLTGSLPILVAVEPFADEVCCYICYDSNQKRSHYLQGLSPPFTLPGGRQIVK